MADTYLDFWNLSQPMFIDNPFGEGLFITEQMKWIKDQILLEHQGRGRFLVVSGDSGVGKSCLTEWLYKDLPMDDYEVAYWSVVQKRPINTERFLTKLASFFGVDDLEYSSETEKKLGDSLEILKEDDKTLVMLVDACEHLNFQEDLKSLSSLVNLLNTAKINHVFCLVGSRGFIESVEEHRDLVPRNMQILLLHKLTKYEMMEFIHNTCQKNNVPTQAFDKDAIDLLYEQTKGNFKLVCLLLEACLNLAFQNNTKKVSLDTLREVVGIANDELVGRSEQQQQLKTSA